MEKPKPLPHPKDVKPDFEVGAVVRVSDKAGSDFIKSVSGKARVKKGEKLKVDELEYSEQWQGWLAKFRFKTAKFYAEFFEEIPKQK